MSRQYLLAISLIVFCPVSRMFGQGTLHISADGYYENRGVNVMLFDDFYPEGHQGGLTIVQAGRRIAANGDVRLEPTPGQWSPVPRVGSRTVDRAAGRISVELWYPDSSKDKKGFNPINYPDVYFRYHITTFSVGESIRLVVDLDRPLPREWVGKIGFNLELFPGTYFGEHYFMDGSAGLFPRQANGPTIRDTDGTLQPVPLAVGRDLVLAPGSPEKEVWIRSEGEDLQLLDGRGLHNNGWFVLRSTIPAGVAAQAVVWTITPTENPDWMYKPIVQVSQAGYHPGQSKWAVIELDRSAAAFGPLRLERITQDSGVVVKEVRTPKPWGNFLRHRYLRFDFSNITQEGLYKIRYGNVTSNEFVISKTVFSGDVWQPSLAYFLPVQMCHMEVRDRYKVWHGYCHMDDARMAPLNHNHFDGYYQHESTLTSFAPGEHVPGLNKGGWHDAGDYDLRIESQAETIYKLALMYELFPDDYDETTIDEDAHRVEIHVPDGKPDILQQIEHGVRSVVGAYTSMGRLYRGIICPTLRQYVHLGDASTITDNLVYRENQRDSILHASLPEDDRWVFTEENPHRELYVAQSLAAASRVLKDFRPAVAGDCLRVAKELYARNFRGDMKARLGAAAELYFTTSDAECQKLLESHADTLCADIFTFSEVIGRLTAELHNPAFTARARTAVRDGLERIVVQQKDNPYGVPYKPYIWGAGWGIQSFGVKALFLHLGFPDIFPLEYSLSALNFVLGCHPGENTASFVSGVGEHSLTVAYGVNRDEWSYIPGGVASGTALIRPDLPELRRWPYFWQQTEYVMGGGTIDFILLAMSADNLLNR